MKRLSLFFGTLGWGGRLQILAVAMLLGWYAWIDYQRDRVIFTVVIFLCAFLTGRLLMPVMVARPKSSYRIWTICNLVYLTLFVLAHDQWWWQKAFAHYIREFLMCLDLSCGYWFLSELRLRQSADEVEKSEADESTGTLAADEDVSPRFHV